MAELALFSPPKVGAPRAQAPRPSARSRAAKPEQSAFSAVLGSDCSPRAKGVCRPGASATPRSRHPANPPESLDFRPPTSKIPYLWGPPRFGLSDGSQNFRVPASASVAHGQKRRQMRPRHSHSEPDSEPPGLIFSSSAAQEVNLSTGTLRTWKTWCQTPTKPRKVLFLGVPPSVPPEPGRAFRVWIP